MRSSSLTLLLALAATLALPVAAAPRDLKLCSAAVPTCDCPRQARSCVPLCHIEPPIACPTT
jgi:hypothetical protein